MAHSSKIMMLVILSVRSLLQISSAQASIRNDSLAQILTVKEKQMFDAITQGNRKKAQLLMGQDYFTINADGTTQGKDEVLKNIEKFKGATYQLSNQKIRIYGTTAIINGKAKFYLKYILVAEIFYTQIWAFRHNKWQYVGWQGTMTGWPTYYASILTAIALVTIISLILLFTGYLKKQVKRI
ncbi:hypothetical protein AHMF7605_27345 [Adhaeribacter arboris]|uniref:DUF4440 domain-containing protein n=1 Tax=Adhaeribacter arboris TaxID=2072846 RepID=A0A2T2YN70_9BACT|nr:nuclear transport factor 2 family protein [Adhaeribacter arboris]PSR56945.1 hypothetical protein AHMF7605_27345 [Adhaeribacter arboris]